MSRRSAIPTATYRLQLHKGFTFADAETCVAYLAKLGISHLYLSPILTARAGSTHGYDGIDPTTINSELGGEPGFRRLAATARAAGLGLILDIVPNHLAVWQADNRLWLDVLENGPASVHARTFDIDFESSEPGLAGKVLAPILGKPYGAALADGEVTLIWDEALGKLAFAYGPHRLPLRPQDCAEVAAGRPPAQADLQVWNNPDRLHALLERQNFRLAHWTAARDAINWRRFFDINELAGLRVEDAEVFALVHDRILQLYAEGLIDGVRVDHVDGLSDPAAYAQALRQQLSALTPRRPPDTPADGPWIVVEKILGADETLPKNWAIDGTTGYDFMDEVSAVQHDPAGEAVLDELWRAQGGTETFEAAETRARREILQDAFAAQSAQAARAFTDLARLDLSTRDLTVETFRRALQALIERLRAYRSYATGRAGGADAGPPIRDALARTRRERPTEAEALTFIAETLEGRGPGPETARFEAARRLNQLTAPVAAKAVEDTAFYRYGRLLSRNDVGFQAGRFSLDRTAFLTTGVARATDWPRAMLTTATHDHKRGEDVRARLAVISELAPLWWAQVEAWSEDTARRRPKRLSPQDDYHLYQTLVGAWPLGLRADDGPGLADFHRRLVGWREKSLREAKLSTSWATPDAAYEADSQAWLATLIDPEQSGAFLRSVKAFVDRIAGAGAINGVTQAALRCAWPGVPDLYQGAELWDLSLVDPDNRRPVDFPHRERLLDAPGDWPSGGVKLMAIAALLRHRREDPGLFRQGTLSPIAVRGRRLAHILAFTRTQDDRQVAIGVMLHVAEAVTQLGDLPSAAWWADTEAFVGAVWRPATALFAASPVFAETVNGSGPKMRTEGRCAR